MKILVTGSSGQIGTNVSLALMNRGDDVVGIDKRDNTWTDRIDTIRADLRRSGPQQIVDGQSFDLVVHLAANA